MVEYEIDGCLIWAGCTLMTNWTLDKPVTSLSTCHVELVGLDGSLVHLSHGACGFG